MLTVSLCDKVDIYFFCSIIRQSIAPVVIGLVIATEYRVIVVPNGTLLMVAVWTSQWAYFIGSDFMITIRL